jgi:hypothetical protein
MVIHASEVGKWVYDNKKTRHRLRRFAKKVATMADKFEAEGIKPNGVAKHEASAERTLSLNMSIVASMRRLLERRWLLVPLAVAIGLLSAFILRLKLEAAYYEYWIFPRDKAVDG